MNQHYHQHGRHAHVQSDTKSKTLLKYHTHSGVKPGDLCSQFRCEHTETHGDNVEMVTIFKD